MAQSVAVATRVQSVEGLSTLQPESQWAVVWRRFRRHKLAVVSSVLLLVVFILSLSATWIAPFDRDHQNLDRTERFALPMSREVGTGRIHIAGTDEIGRDNFTRLLYGARVSLTVAVMVATISTLIGMVVGSLAGYYRGIIDTVLMRFLDFMASIPSLTLLLILTAVLLQDPRLLPYPKWLLNGMTVLLGFEYIRGADESRSVLTLVLVLVLFGWTTTARLMRGMVLSVREREFVEASRALGTGNGRIILRHVVPNSLAPIIVDFTQALAGAFATEVVISFLGFGVQEPTPTWGNMMKIAEGNIFDQGWMALCFGIPILVCSLAFNFIGDGLRDALDPRLKL
jgi:peptide/nickel transport system permease protein